MELSKNEKIKDRIRKIPWFSACGMPYKAKTSFKIKQVRSWKEARTYDSDPNWESTTLEARNALTSFLSKYYTDDYQKWNEYTPSCREFFSTEIMPKIREYIKTNKLGTFISSLRWNLLNAIMEDVYREAADGPLFFLELLKIYESGHVPCGWMGTWQED